MRNKSFEDIGLEFTENSAHYPNGLERINKELKRRSRVVGAFPNDGALLRLGVTILMDINPKKQLNT